VPAYGLTLCLRDDPAAIEQYRREHQQVWPGVLARLREVGIMEMKIFLLGRRLFMYVEAREGFDPARDFPRLSEDPASQRWEELMATLQERAPEAHEDEWWAAMEEVFDLDWPQHRPVAGS
jgi:L-rhamnose mutarotase